MFGIIANMTIKALRLIGNTLYSIGTLILVPVGAVFIASPSLIMLTGFVALLLPLLGAAFVGAGKIMKRKAHQLEVDDVSKQLMDHMNDQYGTPEKS